MPLPPRSGTDRPAVDAYPDSRFATVGGVEVHHTVAGAGPTLLLSHHFYGSTPTWRGFAAALKDRARLVAYDRPGFGLTARPAPVTGRHANPYGRRQVAALAWGLLDHLEVEEAVLVGSSAGGTNVLEMSRQQPERVRALVLVSPAVTGDVGPPGAVRPLLRSRVGRAVGPALLRRVAGTVDLPRVTASWGQPERAGEHHAEPYRRLLATPGWERGLWEVLTADRPPRLAGLLPHVEVPTLVVWGSKDRVIAPRFNRRTAAAIPGGQAVELPGCGHTPQEERPVELAAVVQGFLTEHRILP